MGGGKKDQRWIILGVFALIAVAIVAVILISRGGGDDNGANPTTAAKAAKNGCKEVEAPEPKNVKLKAPEETIEAGEEQTAVVETSCGTFKIELDTKQAPITTNSFAYLAEEGVYDDLSFLRIAPGFVIQGGDPTETQSGDAGYKVEEKPPANLEYTNGVVAMAKSSAEPPGTSGSQFFVVTAPDAGLPAEYALVGKVTEGMDVVEKIGKLPVNGETPKKPVVIESVTIEPGRPG